MVKWIKTSEAVYMSIWREHLGDFHVYESYTSEEHLLTVWGFRDADYPSIKYVQKLEEDYYYIASITKDEE